MNGGFFQELRFKIPVKTVECNLTGKRPGLVIVDEVRGFCEPGCGPLAPSAPDQAIENMVRLTEETARIFAGTGCPILVFADTHTPGVPEPPYPPHCEKGSGQEELMPELSWLERYTTKGISSVTIFRKDCINGFVGGIEGVLGTRAHIHNNLILRWISREDIDTMVVVGICTDICVLDFVVTMLSVRNHRIFGDTPLAGKLKDIVVYVPACSTYDLPREVAVGLGLPPEAAHPRDIMQHMGLKIMADRGAILAHELLF